MRQRLLTDPGAATVLNYLSDGEEKELEEISEDTGIGSERLKEVSAALLKNDFVSREQKLYRINEEELKQILKDLENKIEHQRDDVDQSIRRKDEDLQDLKQEAMENEDKQLFDQIEGIEQSMRSARNLVEKVEILQNINMVLEVSTKHDPDRTRSRIKAVSTLKTVLED